MAKTRIAMIAAVCVCAGDLAAVPLQPRLTALPDNPCALLTPQEMATITQVEQCEHRRVAVPLDLADVESGAGVLDPAELLARRYGILPEK